MQILCTICSDILNHAESIFVTKCGHLFHHHCLTQWIERSKTCPQCRNKVTDRYMFRVYPTAPEAGGGEDAPALQSRLDEASLQLRQLRQKQEEADDKMKRTQHSLQKTIELLKDTEKKLLSYKAKACKRKEKLEYLKVQNKKMQRLREQNERLSGEMLKNTEKRLLSYKTKACALKGQLEYLKVQNKETQRLRDQNETLSSALRESESKKKKQSAQLQAARAHLAVERATNTQTLKGSINTVKDVLFSLKRNLQERLILEARPGKRKGHHQEPPSHLRPFKRHQKDAPDTTANQARQLAMPLPPAPI